MSGRSPQDTRMPSIDALPEAAADLARQTLAWCDAWWDDARGLPRVPDAAGYAGPGVPEGPLHLVPQSAWYAFGLLLRRSEDARDVERARRILGELAALQYDRPGTPWHGSFARFAESPEPPARAVEWQDYDPNWRQFLGTAFAAILHCFGPLLSDDLVETLDRAMALAVRGEPPERVPPSYSNIALLRAFLEVETGARWGELAWVQRGEELAAAVVARFDRHGVFEEYNSPTYYGLDLFALALWRGLSSSPLLRAGGRRLEEALWRDIARWYHPGLRNLCGPFSRTYGMDMNAYVSLLGLWLWEARDREAAPLPPFARDAEHGHDFFLGPLVAALGRPLPDDVRDALGAWKGPRGLEQTLSDAPRRMATAWLDEAWMAGAEDADLDLSGWDQYVAATLHWRHSDGSVAWLAVRAPGPSRARAGSGGLVVDWPVPERPAGGSGERPLVVRVHAPGAAAEDFTASEWRLPGLVVGVAAHLGPPSIAPTAQGATLAFERLAPGASGRLLLRPARS